MRHKSLIIFVTTKKNKNSIAVLSAALEISPVSSCFEIDFVKKEDLYKILKSLQREKIVIAFSFCTPEIIEICHILSEIRSLINDRKNIFLIAGGPHPSGDPEGTLAFGFDIVVIGEGEKVLPHVLLAIHNEESLDSIKGLMAKTPDNRIIKTTRAERVNIDEFPPFSKRYKKFCPIEISRGCPWACRFCQTPFLFGRRMRHRGIENILRYVDILLSEGIKDIRFISSNAFAYGSPDGKTLNLKALEGLLKSTSELVGKDHLYFGTFPSEVRPEHVNRETIDLIKRYTANNNLVIGAQTGSDRMLELINRGHTVKDIYTATKITIDAGLTANIDFIFGLPGETDKDRELTIKVIEELVQMGGRKGERSLVRIHSHTFMPLAGTPYYHSKPVKLDVKTRGVLGRLASQGLQYGQWQTQEKQAFMIYEFLGF